MATIEVTPGMMISIAGEIKQKMEEWDTCVTRIYQYCQELDAMWEGDANKAFNTVMEEDRQKFTNLSSMMMEYQNAVIDMANAYIKQEEEAKLIASRR